MEHVTFESLFGPRFDHREIPDARQRQEANTAHDQNRENFVDVLPLEQAQLFSVVIGKAQQEFLRSGLGPAFLVKLRIGGDQFDHGLLFPYVRAPYEVWPGRQVALLVKPAHTVLNHPHVAFEDAKAQQRAINRHTLAEIFERAKANEAR